MVGIRPCKEETSCESVHSSPAVSSPCRHCRQARRRLTPTHSDTSRKICEAHDGTFVPHPTFWRARCQGSRPSNGADDGLRAPFMICTMQMAGTFFSSPTDQDETTTTLV
jgi:hypothetical protein